MQGVSLLRSSAGPPAAAKTIDCTTQEQIVSAKTWEHPVEGSKVCQCHTLAPIAVPRHSLERDSFRNPGPKGLSICHSMERRLGTCFSGIQLRTSVRWRRAGHELSAMTHKSVQSRTCVVKVLMPDIEHLREEETSQQPHGFDLHVSQM